jgi:hypothetical protein
VGPDLQRGKLETVHRASTCCDEFSKNMGAMESLGPRHSSHASPRGRFFQNPCQQTHHRNGRHALARQRFAPTPQLILVRAANPVQLVVIRSVGTGRTGLAGCTGFYTEPLPDRFKQ